MAQSSVWWFKWTQWAPNNSHKPMEACLQRLGSIYKSGKMMFFDIFLRKNLPRLEEVYSVCMVYIRCMYGVCMVYI